jgi:N-hydroxyarylamine O-acetyltransferase
MDVAAYLNRIGYSGPVALTSETLTQLHLRHLETVPFENLDIWRSRRIVIDPDAFVRKVVEERRGGFCYELNGAFAALLSAIGFRVTLLSGRVSREDGSEGPEFDHLALRVDLHEPWLADVGFGDSFREPLRLKTGIEQKQAGGAFRIIDAGATLKVERQQPDGAWKAEYRFTLAPRELNDFAGMCDFHQTSPESYFTQRRICSRATPSGRITLADLNLIVTENGSRQERMVNSEEEWHRALEQYFGIVL